MIPLLLLLAIGGLMQAARSFSSDISIAGTELAFGYLLLAAYFTAKIISRFGLPKLTGYLLAGVISGPFVLQLVTQDMTVSLRVVSSTATAIIALESGAELDFKKVRPVLRTIRAMTLYSVFGTLALLTLTVFALRPLLSTVFKGIDDSDSLIICIVMGTALAAKSPAVVMALLSETRAEGPLASTILASVVVADLSIIVVFSIASSLASAAIGGGIDVQATVLAVLWELVGSMVFGIAIGMVIGQFLRSARGGASLFALMVCVVVAEVGQRVHLDPLIVMLAAGIWLRNLSRADSRALFQGFASAQLPVFLVFFALAGSGLHIDDLWSAIIPVALLALVRAGSFYLGARLATARTGATDVVRKYAWVGLLPQAGLALALGGVMSTTFPTFGEKAAVILFGVVGFNECIAPVILRFVLLRSGEAGKKEGVDFAAGH